MRVSGDREIYDREICDEAYQELSDGAVVHRGIRSWRHDGRPGLGDPPMSREGWGGKRLETPRSAVLALENVTYLGEWDDLPECERCGRKLRPFRAGVQSWPVTVARATAGACASCYNMGFRDETSRERAQLRSIKGGSGPRALGDTSSGDGNKRIDRRGRARGLGSLARGSEREPISRAERAKGWSEGEHAVAWQVCTHVQSVAEASEIMEMLGLFSAPEERITVFTWGGMDTRFDH